MRIVYLIVLAGLLQGCNGASSISPVEVATLRRELDQTKEELQKLRQDFEMTDLDYKFEKVALLKPGAPGYSLIKGNFGMAAASLEDVKPFANGSKVTLEIGNLTSATIEGFGAQMDWGATDEKGTPINKSGQTKRIDFTQPIRAGSWARADFVVEKVAPRELGFIRLRDASHRGIKLNRVQ